MKNLRATPFVTQIANKQTLGSQYYVLQKLSILSNQIFQSNIRRKLWSNTIIIWYPIVKVKDLLPGRTVQYAAHSHEETRAACFWELKNFLTHQVILPEVFAELMGHLRLLFMKKPKRYDSVGESYWQSSLGPLLLSPLVLFSVVRLLLFENS